MGVLYNQLYSIMRSGLVGIFQATKSNIDWFARFIGVGPRFVYPEVGGFQLLDLIIPELKSHMIPYKFKCSHWWKIHL